MTPEQHIELAEEHSAAAVRSISKGNIDRAQAYAKLAHAQAAIAQAKLQTLANRMLAHR